MTMQAGELPSAHISEPVTTRVTRIEPIPPERVLEELDLTNVQRPLINSVRGSLWGRIGKIIFEQRSTTLLSEPRGGRVIISDFDDCLMSATRWHKKEYLLIGQSEALHRMGANISAETAREIYDLSKIFIPGTAVQEPRYTPRLNLVLLSICAEALRAGAGKEDLPEKSWDELQQWHGVINQQVQTLGDRALNAYAVNPHIYRMFIGNSPADFLYRDFVQDVLTLTSPNDIRVIATRGKIEGPLGQVYKVHSSGLMRERSWKGQGIDLVIYSHDVKAEAILKTMEMLPGIRKRLIQIYDDNPSEVMPFLEMISRLGATNIEVIQVSHPDAKRKDVSVDLVPRLDHMWGETRLRHYTP